MKQIIFFVLLALDFFAKVYAQIDTIYYNNEGQEVHQALSDYQRIAVCDSNDIYHFIDRKLTGEKLANGSYRKTQKGIELEGSLKTYSPDGKTKTEHNYKKGKLDGEQYEYDGNGGKIIKQYKDGVVQGNYYFHITEEGNKTKFSTKDDKMIWESPNPDSRKEQFIQGTNWEYYIANNIVLNATCTIINEYGKWFRIDLCITNGTNEVLDLDPSAMFKNTIDGINHRPSWDYEVYMKKVRRQQNWEAALIGFSAGINAYNASYSTSTITTTTYNQGYSYTNFSTVQTYNPAGAVYANTQNLILFSQLDMEQKASNAQICNNYLRRTTLYPGDTINGYVLVERTKKDKNIEVFVNINGAEYQFNWFVQK